MLDYAELTQHVGHALLCHEYQIGSKNCVAIECFTCEVILTELAESEAN